MNSDANNLPKSFTPKSLSDDFEDIVFDIPIYQRLFAWRDDQVLKLTEDLLEAFPKGEPYYIGILTIAVNNNNLDLIDGQQRVTISILMAIAFTELEPEKCAYWDTYLAGGSRLIFSSRDEDTAYLSARANRETPVFLNPHMERAIDIIKKWCLEKHVDVAKFAEYIWCNLTFFCSYLPENYIDNPIELNRYFVAMGSNGRQLKQHEILLVNLVSEHPQSIALSNLWQEVADTHKRLIPNYDGTTETKAQARQEYKWLLANPTSIFSDNNNSEEIFETIEEIKPSMSENISTTSSDFSKEMLISFEELLLMALDMTLGTESSKQFYQTEHLLTRFEEARLKEKGLVNLFFETLYKCRLLLEYKIIWQESDGNFDYEIMTDDYEHRLEKFQSMLYVCHQGQFYHWLPKYIKWLMNNAESTSADELEMLKTIDHELHPHIPSVGELSYPKVDRYWFWRLDYELWEHRSDEDGWLKDNPSLKDVVNRYVFRVNRSIEHLHPQTPTDDKSEAWDKENLHRFGNLAMISSSFNSLQSNESVGVKMERIHHQIETSQLQSLKMLHMWITYKDGEKWTAEKAKSHEDAMYPYIRRLMALYQTQK